MPKAKILDQLAAILLFLFAVVGCKQLQSVARPTVVLSSDGKFELTVPPGWRENSSLNDQATIKMANPFQEMYVIVITEDKVDFTDGMDLDAYTNLSRNGMTAHLASPVFSPPLPLTINGNAGRQYSLQGDTQNVKLSYIVTTVETAAHFHQVISWTLRSRISQNQITLEHIARTFRPTSGPGGFDPAAPPQ